MEQTNFKREPNPQSSHLAGIQKGKLPPQAVDLEEVVIGALMIDKKGLDEVIDILTPEVFYKPAHQEIFRAIRKLFESSEPIDLLTVSNEMRKNGTIAQIGGEFYLVQLTNKVSSSAHIEFHSRILLEKHILRELIRVSNMIIKKSYDDSTDVFQLLDQAENNLFEIAKGNLKKSSERADVLLKQAMKKIDDIAKQEGLSGVPSGFSKIDKITAGWQKSDLIIIAARPGMGKTAMVLSMAKNMAIKHGHPVGVFSLEMSSVQLITRLISSETGLPSEKLRRGNLKDHEWQQLHSKIKTLENAPVFIDDTPALSVFDLRAKCRRLVSQHKVGIVIIDYLQLMTVGAIKTGNREQEISIISRSLKTIAKELEIPVIALSQLSRAVETRGGSKRPLLSDLRESGAIEQDADIVTFIYRPEYYGLTEWDDEENTSCQGQAEFIIAKHRNGGLDSIRLKFNSELAQFTDLIKGDDFTFESKINRLPENMNLPYPDDAFTKDDLGDNPTEDLPF